MADRAKRDATLSMAPEFEALADMIRSAQSQGGRDVRNTNTVAQAGLDELWRGYSRDVSNINSQVAGSNMGTAGMRFQGLGDLATTKMASEGTIQSARQSSLMTIAQTLSDTIAAAKSKKLGLAKQQGQLELSLRDKYRAEEEAFALQRESNRLARDRFNFDKENAGGKDPATMTLAERNALISGDVNALKTKGTSFDPESGNAIYDPEDAYSRLALKYGYEYVSTPDVLKTIYGAAWQSKFDQINGGFKPAVQHRAPIPTGAVNQMYPAHGNQDRSQLSAGASGLWNALSSAGVVLGAPFTSAVMQTHELATTKQGEKTDSLPSLWEQLFREIWAR